MFSLPASKGSAAYLRGYADYDNSYKLDPDEDFKCPFTDPQDRVDWECGVKNAYIDHITGC